MEGYLEVSDRVNLRETHPTLYRNAMGFALLSISLGMNFFFFKPTFNPFEIDRHIIGAVFLALGIGKLVSILLIRNLHFIRLSMAACGAWMMFWGLGTALAPLSGAASFQLPIMYAYFVYFQFSWFKEPYFNPLTANGGRTHVDPRIE